MNEKKVKQPLRSPRHAWYHRSQTVMDARCFIQRTHIAAVWKHPEEERKDRLRTFTRWHSVVVGPHVSRHKTTTAESSSVKRSEEEVWSQRWHEEVGRQEGWRCRKLDSATAVEALEQDAASPLATRKRVVPWDDTQLEMEEDEVEPEGRKVANEEWAKVEVGGEGGECLEKNHTKDGGFTGHRSMIACRTCTEEEGDPELKQLCGKMEEVCEKNNMELSKRECYFGRGEKTAR